MKGQLSAEMLIVLVIILGLAILLASTMMKSAGKAAEKIEGQAESIANTCSTDAECQQIGKTSCDTQTYRCI